MLGMGVGKMSKKEEAVEQLKNCENMHIWVKPIRDYIEELEAKEERAKKVEELLGLYRKHINTLCKKDREGVKNSLFSSEHLAYELYEKIKTLEEELK